MSSDAPHETSFLEVPRPTETSPSPTPRSLPTPWSLRHLAWLLAFGVLALFVADLLVVTGYVALKPLMDWHTPLNALRDNPFVILAVQSLFYALLFGFIYLLVVVHYRLPFWAALQWRAPTTRQTLGFFFGGILLAFAVGFAPTILPEGKNFPLERMFSSPSAVYALAAFAILVAPLMEELVFRGVLFSVFQHHVGLWFAILSTAALFAALHIPEYWGAWNHVLLILLVGVVFSLARGLTASLAPSVFLHLGYNASLMTALFFSTQHFRAIQGVLAR